MRIGAATARSAAQAMCGPANSAVTKCVTNDETDFTLTFANGFEVRLTGDATTDNDVTVHGGTVSIHPAVS